MPLPPPHFILKCHLGVKKRARECWIGKGGGKDTVKRMSRLRSLSCMDKKKIVGITALDRALRCKNKVG